MTKTNAELLREFMDAGKALQDALGDEWAVSFNVEQAGVKAIVRRYNV